jgi:hypothetical protein
MDEIDLLPVNTRVRTNSRTVIHGVSRRTVDGIIIEVKTAQQLIRFPYHVRWDDGREDIHARYELERVPFDQIMGDDL